jgi:uncharacterized protein (TIGR02266 family)
VNAEGVALRTRSILVVDDAAMFRELQSLFLARQGRVLTAASGKEGIELAHRHRPDVILLDLFMPELDGEAVCRMIRSDPVLQETPVVMLTASQHAEDYERSIRAGANQVLTKPIHRVALIDAVSRYLQSPTPRGMPRVDVAAAVRIQRAGGECTGTATNLSRGGMFVESSCDATPPEELSLEFSLPETLYVLTPTARVVWRRGPEGEHPPGFGLRFVRIDGESVRTLSEFVSERFAAPL